MHSRKIKKEFELDEVIQLSSAEEQTIQAGIDDLVDEILKKEKLSPEKVKNLSSSVVVRVELDVE